MRNGFNFNGTHSSQFGVSVKTKSRPIRPSARSAYLQVPYRDGSYDFSTSNPYGREFYNDRQFSVTISVCADNLNLMQKKLTQLSSWLCGSGELIFDDIPLVVWTGSVTDEIIYMPEHRGHTAVLEVTFTVRPFSDCVFDMNGPYIGMDSIVLDDSFPISIDELYTYTVSGNGDVVIMNVGDRPVRPVIEISGDTADIRLGLNGKYILFNADGDTVVDFDRQSITNKNGRVKITGEFFEFPKGENILNVKNSSSGELTLVVNYKPQFMYNLCFDDMDWGVGDA